MQFTVTHNDQTLSVDTIYRKSGKDMILLIHGLGCIKESFEEITKQSAFDQYTILAPDLIGYGKSDKPDAFSYNMEDQANVLKKLLEQIPYENVHIVVHSMGGAIGLLLAKELPRIASFTNIEGNLIPEDSGLLSRKTAGVTFDEFNASVFDELRDMMSSVNEYGAKLWIVWTRQCSPRAFYNSAISLMQWSDTGELLQIFLNLPCKKMYMYGDKNVSMPIVSKLDASIKVEIPDSGHFVMNDNPEVFYKELKRFIG
jgi:pimeloyl-ACP methyl ester carboxylesterase